MNIYGVLQFSGGVCVSKWPVAGSEQHLEIECRVMNPEFRIFDVE